MCYTSVSWHQIWKPYLHIAGRLSEPHHTVTLLSSKGKKTSFHTLWNEPQSCSLQGCSYSRILKVYTIIIPRKFSSTSLEICSWATLRTHSAQTVIHKCQLVTEVRIQPLNCWDTGSNLNLSFTLASKIRAHLQKWNYTDTCVHNGNKLPYMLHYTQRQHELFKFSAEHNSKTTFSRHQAMIVRRVLQENTFRHGWISFPTSVMAEWAAPNNISYMLYASLPALQRNWYRECHSNTAVEHIYQEIFATQKNMEGHFPISSFIEVSRNYSNNLAKIWSNL